jgi:tetratricopeptide (TPR) repeat protein
MTDADEWQARVDAVWADADQLGGEGVISAIDALAAERPADDALALFEQAGARDSAGLEQEAEPLYRDAISAGLPDDEHGQAVIQLASTIRNLGRAEESLDLIRTEFAGRPEHPYADAAAAMEALALASLGRPTEGLAVTIHALVKHMPRYHRSMHAYADALTSPSAE